MLWTIIGILVIAALATYLLVKMRKVAEESALEFHDHDSEVLSNETEEEIPFGWMYPEEEIDEIYMLSQEYASVQMHTVKLGELYHIILTPHTKEETERSIQEHSMHANWCVQCQGLLLPDTPIGRDDEGKISHLIPCGIVNMHAYAGRIGAEHDPIAVQHFPQQSLDQECEYILVGVYCKDTPVRWG